MTPEDFEKIGQRAIETNAVVSGELVPAGSQVTVSAKLIGTDHYRIEGRCVKQLSKRELGRALWSLWSTLNNLQ